LLRTISEQQRSLGDSAAEIYEQQAEADQGRAQVLRLMPNGTASGSTGE
jgi:hypothetical protein